jgi:tetratricopeptide (TPR) repeat protein
MAIWEASFSNLWTLKDMVAATATGIQRTLLKVVEAKLPKTGVMSDSVYDAIAGGDFALLSSTVAGADSARALYERAVRLDPQSAESAARLALSYALVLERGGRIPGLAEQAALTRAVALTTQALATDPALSEAWTVRGILARLYDPVGFGGAIAAHTRAVSLNPNDATAWHEFGITMLRRGLLAEAESRFRRALSIEPNRAASLAMLGDVMLRRNRPSEACLMTNASIDAWPFDPVPYIVRARARLLLGQTRDAYADSETAAKLTNAAWIQAVHVLVQVRAGNELGARREADILAARWLRRGETLAVRDATHLALAFASIRDRRRTIEAIRRARPQGLDLVVAVRDDAFDFVRGDTAVVRIIREASTGRGP